MTKRIITKSLILLTICSSIFAQNGNIDSEEYLENNDIAESIMQTEADEYEQTESENDDLFTKQKKKDGFFKDFFTFGNKGKFIVIDETSCYSKGLSGSLKQYSSSVVVKIDTEEAGFMSKNNGLYYAVFMDKNSRQLLKKSAEKYLDDFANKKLDRNNKKSWKLYNKFNISLAWGSIKTSTPNHGKGAVNTGYEFNGKSPYFIITIPEMPNDYLEYNKSAAKTSNRIKFYFTKSQITTLLSMIEEEKIAATINNYNIQEYGVIQDADNY